MILKTLSKCSQVTNWDKNKTQELIYQAWEADSREEAAVLAKKAVEIWPDCSDGYYILADETENIYDAKRLFEEAVRREKELSGRRNLGRISGVFGDFRGRAPI